MAQIKTPYGLVYNTDGSLCTTYRDDDIPFQGVRSFAVEEATTNLMDESGPYSGVYLQLVNLTDVSAQENKYWAMKVEKIESGAVFSNQVGISCIPNTTYTLSVWVKKINMSDSSSIFIYLQDNVTASYTATYISGRDLSTSEYRRFSVSFTTAEDATSFIRVAFHYGGLAVGESVILANWQLEAKPYSTSFVDGSRPAGILKIDNQYIPPINFVLTFWAKPNNDLSLGYVGRLINKTGGTSLDEGFGIYNSGGGPNWGFMVGGNNVGSSFFANPTKWYFFFLAFLETETKYIVIDEDENEINDVTSSVVIPETHIEHDLIFGNNEQKDRSNNIRVANIFIGKYRKPDGTVIWTDDYIREVYEAKIPFPVSNKLSIY